jgi:DNA-binding beta-propeller fold protein YncE
MRRLALLLILALAVLPAAAARAGEKGHYDGTIYVESNNYRKDRGSVFAFRYAEGKISPKPREYRTGGHGSHDLSNSGVLDIDGSLALSSERRFLFAVNTGTDTIAVMKITSSGGLKPVAGSPFPSQGAAPASVDYSDGHLFVANKAHDGLRDLTQVAPNYAAFAVSGAGRLTPVGTPQPAPPGSSPTQAFVTPGGGLLLGSDEQGATPFSAGQLHSFVIGGDGALTAAPGTPQDLDPSILALKGERQAVWAQGFIARADKRLVYAGVANLKLLVIYRYNANGSLTFVRAMPNKRSVLPCWTEMSKDGRYLFTGNAGNNSLSVFDLKNPEKPKQIQHLALKGAGNPWNFTVDPSGRHIFLVDMRAVRQLPPDVGNELHVIDIGKNGKLEERQEPVKIPVPTGTNPWGIAVVPHHG